MPLFVVLSKQIPHNWSSRLRPSGNDLSFLVLVHPAFQPAVMYSLNRARISASAMFRNSSIPRRKPLTSSSMLRVSRPLLSNQYLLVGLLRPQASVCAFNRRTTMSHHIPLACSENKRQERSTRTSSRHKHNKQKPQKQNLQEKITGFELFSPCPLDLTQNDSIDGGKVVQQIASAIQEKAKTTMN